VVLLKLMEDIAFSKADRVEWKLEVDTAWVVVILENDSKALASHSRPRHRRLAISGVLWKS
jgi:hypothetical protein